MQINKYDHTWGNPEFYALMGKYFAEPMYRKEIPYLVNRKDNVWLVAIKDNKVVGFVAINETSNRIIFEHDYIEHEYRNNGLFEKLNKKRLDLVKNNNKNIEIVVLQAYLIEYWGKKGFKPFRANGAYTYLRKEANKIEN